MFPLPNEEVEDTEWEKDIIFDPDNMPEPLGECDLLS